MKFQIKMRCCKARQILGYHKPNKVLYSEIYDHPLFFLFYLFRDAKNYYQGDHYCITINVLKHGVQTVININKIKFKCNNATFLDNQDPFGQVKNDETKKAVYFSDQDDENTKSNRNWAIPNFMPRNMPDNEIFQRINPLNSKQRDIFSVAPN